MNQVNSPAYYQGTGQPVTPQQVANAGISQQASMPPNQLSFNADADIVNDGLVDPIVKCRELSSHLIQSLQVCWIKIQ